MDTLYSLNPSPVSPPVEELVCAERVVVWTAGENLAKTPPAAAGSATPRAWNTLDTIKRMFVLKKPRTRNLYSIGKLITVHLLLSILNTASLG